MGNLVAFGLTKINLDESALSIVMAIVKYIFIVILPLGAFYLITKHNENQKYLKNLKYSIYPLFKFEIILHLLISGFFMLGTLYAFMTYNTFLTDAWAVVIPLLESGKVEEIDKLIPYLREHNPETIVSFIYNFESVSFLTSVVMAFLFISFFFSVSLLSTNILLTTETTFIKSIKESLHKHFSFILAIIGALFVLASALSLIDINSAESKFTVFAFLFVKSFIIASILNFYYYLGVINKSSNENKTEETTNGDESSSDDPYNVEIND
jgi:hypothetical protein